MTRGTWSGHVGFILAAAGSAVGLGNIWRFPYMAGENGGGAFVLVYLAAVFFVGVPLLVAEVMIGRATARNPVGAFRVLGPGSAWPLVGWLGVAAGFVILSYYGVVAGWALDYALRAVTGGFAEFAGGAAGGGQAAAASTFDALTASGGRQVLMQAAFMLVTVVVVSRGIEAGIERANRILMPLLFGFLLVLLAYGLTSPGAAQGLDFMLRPRFSELTAQGVLDALGQAFFSLSIGMGAMITYGSYLERDRSVAGAAVFIAGMDTMVAILAGLVIFPLVFSFGLEPASGPGLVFLTLPPVFASLPASSLLASLFFGLLLFAALTSAVSLLEVVVAFVVDEFTVRRATASWGIGLAIFALGIPSALSGDFLGQLDTIANNWMLPIGGVAIAVFAGWILSDAQARSAYGGEEGNLRGFAGWSVCIRYIGPVAVGAILLQNIGLLAWTGWGSNP
jgi:NSS family neurotransmitter:Na+ symporter